MFYSRFDSNLLIAVVGLVLVQISLAIGRNYDFLLVVNDHCTGALISERHVLISFRCVNQGEPNQFVRLQVANDIAQPSPYFRFQAGNDLRPEVSDKIPIASVIIRDRLAVAVLEKRIPNIEPVPIYRRRHAELSEDSNLHLVGWEAEGRSDSCVKTKQDQLVGYLSNIKRECGSPSDDPVICVEMDWSDGVCVADTSRCRGVLIDLARRANGTRLRSVLVGVPSYHLNCGSPDRRSFVDVSKFANWLIDATDETVRFYSPTSRRQSYQ